jgi:GntR family transcriptional regulator
MINMTKNPQYLDVYYTLKKQINTGAYVKGDFLPVEGELEKIFGVSRTTIRKAIEMLRGDGYLEVKQGRGTRVLDIHYTQNLNYVSSVSETLRQKGYKVTTKSIYIDIVKASKFLAEVLNVPVDADLYRVQRVQLADNIPAAIMINYIHIDLAPGLNEKADKITSLYKFLESEYNLSIDASKNTISAKNADFTEANMLDIHINSALITINRVTYGLGTPITYDCSTIRADIYQFEIASTGR